MQNAELEKMRQRLQTIIADKSFSVGDNVTLASGRSSNFYFNMKPTMLDPEGAALIGELCLNELERRYVRADYVGGLELGAVPIASVIAATSFEHENTLPAFVVRKAKKEHGTQKRIEGLPEGETLRGKRVVIVEDVTTTGGSSLQAVELVKAEGAEVVMVLTLVDREEGADQSFRIEDVPFAALFKASSFKGNVQRKTDLDDDLDDLYS